MLPFVWFCDAEIIRYPAPCFFCNAISSGVKKNHVSLGIIAIWFQNCVQIGKGRDRKEFFAG